MNSLKSYANFYRFKARLYHIPVSRNIKGVDPYPRFFVKPSELIEVLEFSTSSNSIDDGYLKDEHTGLYVRDHSKVNDGTVTEQEINAQFAEISMNPPYWYSNSDSYVQWVNINMDPAHSATMEAMFNLYSPVTIVEEGEDDLIPVTHYYVEFEESTTKKFSEPIIVNWPKQPKVIFRTITE